MQRWLHIIAATALWSFLLVGLMGLADAALNANLYGRPGGPGISGAVSGMLPSFTLYGWFGLTVGLLIALPLTLVARGREDALRIAPVQAIATAMSVVVVVWIGYFVHETPVGLWWDAHLGPLWVPLMIVALGLALLLAMPLRRHAPLVMAKSRIVLPVLLVVVLGASWQWPDHRGLARRQHIDGLAVSAAPAAAPNVLVISIDALRRDKLTCVNPDAPPTPHLDGLAASGHLYTNAWSVTGWTLPAMAAVMTGLPPRTLGVTRFVGLPAAVPTLAQSAWSSGWWTAGLVANPYLGEEFGFQRGFAEFDHTDVVEPLRPARRTILARELNRYLVERTDLTDGRRLVAQAARWLHGYDGERPFFYWIHLMDPHIPYRAHPDADGRDPELFEHALLEPDRFADTASLREALPSVPAEVLQAVEDLYDGEVRYADRCVGELLDALETAGYGDDTWIIVLSDHGEEFFEHGGFEHGHSLMPEVSGVPLLIRPPGGLSRSVRDDRAVSLLDLAPSLCQALDWTPPPSMAGEPCLLSDTVCSPGGLTVLENMLYGPAQQAVMRWPEFRVVELESGASAWYDLQRDPWARTPMAPPPDAAAVRDGVRELVAGWEDHAEALSALDRDEAELSDTARRRLRSLGY